MEHSTYFPDCFYRVTVKGICVQDGKILCIREKNKHWELPGGGLDFGEKIHEGFKREVEEEMGLKVKKISKKPIYIWTHRYEPNVRNIGWYYTLVLAYRVEFEDLNFSPTSECEEIRFFTKEELQHLTYAGQTTHIKDLFNPEDFKEEF